MGRERQSSWSVDRRFSEGHHAVVDIVDEMPSRDLVRDAEV